MQKYLEQRAQRFTRSSYKPSSSAYSRPPSRPNVQVPDTIRKKDAHWNSTDPRAGIARGFDLLGQIEQAADWFVRTRSESAKNTIAEAIAAQLGPNQVVEVSVEPADFDPIAGAYSEVQVTEFTPTTGPTIKSSTSQTFLVHSSTTGPVSASQRQVTVPTTSGDAGVKVQGTKEGGGIKDYFPDWNPDPIATGHEVDDASKYDNVA